MTTPQIDESDLGGRNPFDLTGGTRSSPARRGRCGRALATALAEVGANVSVTTSNDNAAEEPRPTRSSTSAGRSDATGAAKRVDLTDPAAVEAAVAAVESEIGPLDILVNASHYANIKPVPRRLPRRLETRSSTATPPRSSSPRRRSAGAWCSAAGAAS